MIRSMWRRRRGIPGAGTSKAQNEGYEYVKGWNSNLSNDNVPPDQWRHGQDVRQPELGKWVTRKGNEHLSVPIGEAVDTEQTSTTGADDQEVSTTTWIAKKVTATTSKPVTKIEVNARNNSTGTGSLVLALHDDNSGEPGDLLFKTTVDEDDLAASYAYETGYSITCPTLSTSSVYWVVVYVQDGGTGNYEVSTTTNATSGLVSTDSGATWAAASADFNVKVYTATAGGAKGIARFERPNGTVVTLLAHGTNLYTVNESTGATTSIDSNLGSGSTEVRIAFVNDTLYYTDGTQKPRKYNFSANSSVSDALENARDVISHKGLLFYVSAVDPTKMYFSNFADYDEFTSTDFIYVPAPKTADPIQRLMAFNGILYILTRHSKYALLGSSNQDFRLEPAISQKGLVSPHGLTHDENYIYLASDDGIYRYNGAEERNIAEDILNQWTELDAKENTVMEVFNNRLYVWYTPNGETDNTQCFVYNTLYDHWESLDTLGFIGRADGSDSFDETFLQASNRVGMVMLGEPDANDYCSMGEPVEYELYTAYTHAKAPQRFKRAPYFRPHLSSPDGAYAVSVGYDFDFAEDPTYTEISLTSATNVNPLDELRVEGEFRRLQVRYKHHAARQPVGVDGHLITFEIQRVM